MKTKKPALGAGHSTRQPEVYRNHFAASRKNLERAAEILLLMQHRLTVTERAGFAMLLQRRLEGAYPEGFS